MKIILLLTILTLFYSPCFAQQAQNKCRDWQLRVDPKTSFHFKSSDDATQEEIYVAIDCLLELKGEKYSSNLPNANRADFSQFFFEPTSVEVAALYFITYLVYQKWDYADAPYLVNKKGKLNTSKSVADTYKAYRIWLKKVKEIGLEETRKQKLNPLEGSKIRWYYD